MKTVILGIDTGGTFTDGVLVEQGSGKVLAKTKANTTRNDLSIGIGNCVRNLNLQSSDYRVKTVCLSTTLATNSVVENRKSRVGLISMEEDVLKEKPGVVCSATVKGLVDLDGSIKQNIDENEIREAVMAMKGRIDALVVSGFFSVRNPSHELKVKEIATEILGIPVICGHDLSMSLGLKERTATAVLNANLLPVIEELISKTREIMDAENIDADLLVMRGDGTMMKEKSSLSYPVETVLSGPAASVVGGVSMISEENAMFVDLGGTTTDIADMTEGRVSITEDGATINGWRTKVRAADVYTYGLGGDSRLHVDQKNRGKISFGPEKAIPVCFAAEQNPGLIDEIRKYCKKRNQKTLPGFLGVEALQLNDNRLSGFDRNSGIQAVIDVLSDGPHCAGYVAEKLDPAQRRYSTQDLISRGAVSIISITPTDLMHASGEFSEWNAEAARTCIELIKGRDETVEECTYRMSKSFLDQLAWAVARSAFAFDGTFNELLDGDWFRNALASDRGIGNLRCRIGKNIVAIGAPAKAWLAKLADSLDTEVVVPENYEVANAIGAANGRITETIFAEVHMGGKGKHTYKVHTREKVQQCSGYDHARKWALNYLHEKAEEIIRENHMASCTKQIDEDIDYLVAPVDEGGEIYKNMITMTVAEKPACFR